jgi:hypothetical protein
VEFPEVYMCNLHNVINAFAITPSFIRSEESYRLWRVAMCDQVTSYPRRLKPSRAVKYTPTTGCVAPGEEEELHRIGNFINE